VKLRRADVLKKYVGVFWESIALGCLERAGKSV